MTDDGFLNNLDAAKLISKYEEEILCKKENFISEKLNETTEIISSNKVDCSTSTNDLVDDFTLGYFSKAQLMSSFSLYNTKSTLYNSFSNTEYQQYEDKNELMNKTEYYYSYCKEYFVKSKDGKLIVAPPTHISGLTIQTNDTRQRPTRSNNWSLLNRPNSSDPIEIALPISTNSSIQQQTSSYRFFPPYKYIRQQGPPQIFKSAKF